MDEFSIKSCTHCARAKVILRVSNSDAARAAQALELPTEPISWIGTDPARLWVGPDQWLLLSDSRSPDELVLECATRLQGLLHHAADISAALACIVVEGRSARAILGMGSAIDFHRSAFGVARCVRTRFAGVAALIRAVAPESFELYVDRSLTDYLERWFANASADPLLRAPMFREGPEPG